MMYAVADQLDDMSADLWSRDLPEWEIWACARAVELHYSDRGSAYILERLASMVIARDETGLATWSRIDRAYNQLIKEQPISS